MDFCDRRLVTSAAQAILSRGGWCLLERCSGEAEQCWEPRVLVFDLTPDAVADAIEEELAAEPELDGRLTGCDRRTLMAEPAMGAHVCYLARRPPTRATTRISR